MVTKQNDVAKEQLSKLLEVQQPITGHGPRIGHRHFQILLLFLVVLMNYFIRISMSVIIVAMTDPTSSTNHDVPTYNWTDKSLVVSSFMWGYMVPQIGAGYLATAYGAKWFLAASLLASSSMGFFVPLIAAYVGSKGVMFVRIGQGLVQGFLFPSTHAFLGKWVPVSERSRLGAFPYIGATVGTIGATIISGYLAASPLGWPMALYIFSVVGILVGVLFAYFAYSSPDDHPSILQEERAFIQHNPSTSTNVDAKGIPVPWLEIFSSVEFWALIIAQTGFSWINWTLLFETPIYINRVLNFDLKSNGILSSLQPAADTLFSLVYSVIADYVIVRNICSIGTTRKIMNAIAMLGTAFLVVCLGYFEAKDSVKAVVTFALLGVFSAASKSGYNVNQIDLSPNFAGVLMGISNGFSAAICSLAPLSVHALVKDENEAHQWRVIFIIASLIAVLSYIFNAVFGSGSVQPWNNGSRKIRERYETLEVKIIDMGQSSKK